MARLFNGTTQYLETTTVPAVGPPVSFAAWIRPSSLAASAIIGVSRNSGTTQRAYLGLSAAGLITAISQSSGTTRTASTSAATSASTWAHACAVFASSTSRSVYLNGASKGTNTQNSSPTGLNRGNIGMVYAGTSASLFFPGDIAEVACWNVALTDGDAALLAKGVSPYLVKGNNLLAYWPLVGRYSPEISLFGGFDLTLTAAPTVSDHPPMRYAASPPKPQLRHIGVQTAVSMAAVAVGVSGLSYLLIPGPPPPPSEGGGGGTAALGGTGLGSTVQKSRLRWAQRRRRWPVRP